jgi:hypothetical protein
MKNGETLQDGGIEVTADMMKAYAAYARARAAN